MTRLKAIFEDRLWCLLGLSGILVLAACVAR